METFTKKGDTNIRKDHYFNSERPLNEDFQYF